MIPRRIYGHIRSHNWFAVGIDFLIVVVGVFVGVQVNEWWTGLSETRREHAYLAALKEDFAQVEAELRHDAGEYEAVADSMLTLLAQSRLDAPTIAVADLNQAFGAVIVMVSTRVVADTYENLTGSGDLRIIQNQKLKNQLASFYAQVRIIRLVEATHEMQLVNLFQPYIVGNLDYLAAFGARVPRLPPRYRDAVPAAYDDKRILHVLRSAEFRNIVSVKFDIATDTLDVINSAQLQADQIAALLDEELR